MDVAKMSGAEQHAVRRAMEYWVEHWDWECTTLFGIELDELKQALNRWPLQADKSLIEAATLGVLRELIYGASSLPKAAIHGAIGISYDQAHLLIEMLNND